MWLMALDRRNNNSFSVLWEGFRAFSGIWSSSMKPPLSEPTSSCQPAVYYITLPRMSTFCDYITVWHPAFEKLRGGCMRVCVKHLQHVRWAPSVSSQLMIETPNEDGWWDGSWSPDPQWLDTAAVIGRLCFPLTGITGHFAGPAQPLAALGYSWKHLGAEELRPPGLLLRWARVRLTLD